MPYVAFRKDTTLEALSTEAKVRARDARHHLQEGHDANDAVDAVPWRDEFSPASSPQCNETAGASSPTTIALLVRVHKAAANNATTAMLAYT
jgi:hypothetical protein